MGVKFGFERQIAIYLFIGTATNNLIRGIWEWFGNNEGSWLYYYIFWLPPLVLSILSYILMTRIQKKELKSFLFVIIGVANGLSFQVIFIAPSSIPVAIHFVIGIIIGGIIHFNRFESVENVVAKFKENNLIHKQERIAIIHNEVLFWLRIFITLIFWGVVALISIITILFSFWGESKYELSLKVSGLYFTIMFIYIFAGLLKWMIFPLTHQLEIIHDTLSQN